jgi:hypothetical protein
VAAFELAREQIAKPALEQRHLVRWAWMRTSVRDDMCVLSGCKEDELSRKDVEVQSFSEFSPDDAITNGTRTMTKVVNPSDNAGCNLHRRVSEENKVFCIFWIHHHTKHNKNDDNDNDDNDNEDAKVITMPRRKKSQTRQPGAQKPQPGPLCRARGVCVCVCVCRDTNDTIRTQREFEAGSIGQRRWRDWVCFSFGLPCRLDQS